MLSPSPLAGDAARSRSSPPRIKSTARILLALSAWTWLVVAVTAQTLPYVPTSIFVPVPKLGDSVAEELAYIFSPRGNSVDLLSLDISATLTASSLTLNTLSSGLPFLENANTAFVPSLADNGSLLVYAGNCSTSNGSGIWSFNPSATGASSTLWTQEDIKPAGDAEWIDMGPGFLGAGFSFSTVLEPKTSPANTFVYGGMCPNRDSYQTNPQSQATYTNQMVKISPSTSDSKGYTVKPVESNGPPIPEAGFTFTSLSPSFSNRSGIITQQIDYVLLGGHTQYAFINMSTVAIWSLPQESWSFVSDVSMTGNGPDDSVDSRSGHTTILNADGTTLVILGGWVGDVNQAAFPQLAVLRMGSDYGGDGGWEWSIPDSQPPGDGIYGHGAALLPGNVMMVYGGYAISSSGTSNRRRAGDSTASFLNLTSMTWSDDYTNPSYTGNSAEGNMGSMNDDQKKKLGVGVGLGLGLGLLLLLAILGYLYYRKRKLNRRIVPDATIRALAQDNSRFLGHDEMAAEHDQGNNWYMGGPDPYARGGRSLGYSSLQTGRVSVENSRQNWFGDIAPPPPQMMQKNRKPIAPRAARGQHQPGSSAGYEPVSNPRGPGGMNPIFEADEDDTGDIGEEAISPVRDERRDSGAYSDPFVTPTRERPISFPPQGRAFQTPSPEERKRASVPSVTDPDVQDWMTDMDAADALLSGRVTSPRTAATTGPGRTSPSRRGFNATNDEDGSRTESNISESNRSNLSRSGSLLRQLRPGFGVAVAAALAATTEGRGGSSSSSDPSYDTARSSFNALQAEGPGLLLGRDREREEGLDDEPDEPGSPSKNKPRRSWLGSLRRVFSNPSPDSAGSGAKDENSPLQGDFVETNDFEARLGSLGGIGGIAADGLLRRKGGRGAWEPAEAGPSQGATRYSPLHGGQGGNEQNPDDEEWDIEKAVEKRLVQVMFTVPKEPLRVVNGEPDFVSERDIVLVDRESDESRRDSEDRAWTPDVERGLSIPPAAQPEPLRRPRSTPSPLGDEDKKRPSDSSEDAEKEALRRELDAEWERIENEVAAPQPPRTPPRPLQLRPGPRTSQLDIPRRPPLLHGQHALRLEPSPDPNAAMSLALEEQIDKLGAELHQARSAAQTPMSTISHHSDADVLSAEAIRYERPPSGSTSTLQITPLLTPNLRAGNNNNNNTATSPGPSTHKNNPNTPSSLQKKRADYRSESNLRGANELRAARRSHNGGGGGGGSNNGSPTRRVRAMVEEFESKSSREASPAGSPVKGSPSPRRSGSPSGGAPLR